MGMSLNFFNRNLVSFSEIHQLWLITRNFLELTTQLLDHLSGPWIALYLDLSGGSERLLSSLREGRVIPGTIGSTSESLVSMSVILKMWFAEKKLTSSSREIGRSNKKLCIY